VELACTTINGLAQETGSKGFCYRSVIESIRFSMSHRVLASISTQVNKELPVF
jgi:hypothetical protein